MAAYLIGQVNIVNKEPYKEYVEKTSSIVKNYGGKFLVRGGKFNNVLGNWKYTRNVVIEFNSYDDAIRWYNSKEYKNIRKIREKNSEGNIIIIEGV